MARSGFLISVAILSLVAFPAVARDGGGHGGGFHGGFRGHDRFRGGVFFGGIGGYYDPGFYYPYAVPYAPGSAWYYCPAAKRLLPLRLILPGAVAACAGPAVTGTASMRWY